MITWYKSARNTGNEFWWSVNHALWHSVWFYRNIFPYGYKLGRGFLWRKRI